ncbi:MAG: sulfurtransferase TusA family protein [Deltaproteobacteria bacterium]|nr:sulfurtransferase TusA family protein [Deltaproteobacteria bacterium]
MHGVTTRVDARGQPCPLPILALARACRGLERGASVEVLATDPAFPADVRAWCEARGAALKRIAAEGTHWRAELLAPGQPAKVLDSGPGLPSTTRLS